MPNFRTNLDKILDEIEPFAQDIVNQTGNMPRPNVSPKF